MQQREPQECNNLNEPNKSYSKVFKEALKITFFVLILAKDLCLTNCFTSLLTYWLLFKKTHETNTKSAEIGTIIHENKTNYSNIVCRKFLIKPICVGQWRRNASNFGGLGTKRTVFDRFGPLILLSTFNWFLPGFSGQNSSIMCLLLCPNDP